MNPRTYIIKIRHMGEINKIEEEAKKFITPQMNGIDIGTGGVPILLQSISIDFNYPGQYSELVQLKGDAKNLYWFKDNCMDYVFSSHCFEDIEPANKVATFKEWLRVIKVGGIMLLYLPDERIYREYNKAHGAIPNGAHKDANFNIDTMRNIAKQFPIKEIYSIPNHGDYCFFIVFQKLDTM